MSRKHPEPKQDEFAEANEAAQAIAVASPDDDETGVAAMGFPIHAAQNAPTTPETPDLEAEAPVGNLGESPVLPDAGSASSATTTRPAQAITDIPDEVKSQMVGYAQMELELLLLKCLNAYPHPVNVDRIILTLWYNHQQKKDRMSVIRCLRILSKDGRANKIDGTRGLYQITDLGKTLLA